MNREQDFRAGKVQPAPSVDIEGISIEALTFFASFPEEGQRFFAWSGLDAGSVRAAAHDPSFALGVLDYFSQNLRSLERFCDGAGLAPSEVLRSHEALKTHGLTSHDEL